MSERRALGRRAATRAKLLLGRHALQRRALQAFWDRLHRLSLWGMGIGVTAARPANSGEVWLVERVAEHVGPAEEVVVFDVGANVGAYAAAAARCLGERGRIHCFEPSSAVHEELIETISPYANAQAHRVALSDADGHAELHSYTGDSGFSSLYDRRLDALPVELEGTEQVELTTIDAFCAANGIKRITLLKVDVEGHELAVLRGAERMLRAGAVDLVQFEYGGASRDARTFLYDFWDLLRDRYELCRLLPRGLAPVPRYEPRLEILELTNYVAVARSANGLARLAG